jgi:hypothetical protein
MPNQANYRTDISNKTDPRYMVSRIVKMPEDGVLLEEIPASFGFDELDNIEVHFYTISGNKLMLSTTIRLEESAILKSHVVSYDDGTFKNYIRIDFTELFSSNEILLIPGEYHMVLNFFSDEIGRYDNRTLFVQKISPSRTEVVVAFIDNVSPINIENNKKIIYEFIEPSFNKAVAVGVAEKIFKSGVITQDSLEGLTYENVVQNINIPHQGQFYDSTIKKLIDIGLEEHFITEFNNFLLILFESIKEEIIIKGDKRIQKEEFLQIISEIVTRKVSELQASVDRRITLT